MIRNGLIIDPCPLGGRFLGQEDEAIPLTLNDSVVLLDLHIAEERDVHSFVATIPGIIGGAVQVKLRIGVYQDSANDLTWADITNLQMAP